QVEVAAEMMEDLSKAESLGAFQGAVRHRQVVARGAKAMREMRAPTRPALLFAATTPRAVPGSGGLAQEAGSWAPWLFAELLEKGPVGTAGGGATAPPAPPPRQQLPGMSWRATTHGLSAHRVVPP